MQVFINSMPSASKAAAARASRGHFLCLPEPLVGSKIQPARIGDDGNADHALLWRQPCKVAEPSDSSLTETLGVHHDERLRDGYEIGGIEERADRELMAHCTLPRRSELAGRHCTLLVIDLHRLGFAPISEASASSAVPGAHMRALPQN
jgi:hypothetical protein